MGSHKSGDYGQDESKEVDESTFSNSNSNIDPEKAEAIPRAPSEELRTKDELASHRELQHASQIASAQKDLSTAGDHVTARNTNGRAASISDYILFIPPWCRWDENNPPKFRTWHNVLFALAGGCTVANLYYNHPILNILAEDFHTNQAGVSKIPTLMQAGYATGLLFILPVGDMMPIRAVTLGCIAFTAVVW